MVLWILHQEFGFGPERLRRFHERFFAGMDALVKRYEIVSRVAYKYHGVEFESDKTLPDYTFIEPQGPAVPLGRTDGRPFQSGAHPYRSDHIRWRILPPDCYRPEPDSRSRLRWQSCTSI